jgi:CheY-like chemotaxis protein
MSHPFLLVADDDEASCQMVQALLTEWDYVVVCAADGAQLLGLLDQVIPAAIITDLFLPGLPVQELLRVLAERQHAIPLIVLTSNAAERHVIADLVNVLALSRPLVAEQVRLAVQQVAPGTLAICMVA